MKYALFCSLFWLLGHLAIGQDLIVASIDAPDQENPGEQIRIEVYVENIGSSGAPISQLKYYISPNTTLAAGGATPIGSDQVKALSPGLDEDEILWWNIPSGYTPGQYYIIALCDAYNDVTESDENNNEDFHPIIIGDYTPVNCTSRPNEEPTWDWRIPEYTMYIKEGLSYRIDYVESPWFASTSNNANINEFRLQNPKDFEPSDGWELLLRDFGTPMNPVDHPFFILYNRHTGILRFFGIIGNREEDYNAANVQWGIEPGSLRNAIMENNTTNRGRGALDNWDPAVDPINVSNEFVNATEYWLHGDFVTNYDPCQCEQGSQMFFAVQLISEATMKFDINGTLTGTLDPSGRTSDNGRQSIEKGLAGLGKAANIKWADKSKAKNWFDTHFAPVKNVFAVSSAVLTGVTGLQSLFSGAKMLLSVNNGQPATSNPMMYDVDLNGTGDITYTNPFIDELISVPGSDNLTQLPPVVIEYNNNLGIFNLVETPVIQYTRINDCSGYHAIHDMMKIKEPVQYTVNPEAEFDVDNLEIKAAIVVESPDYYSGSQVPFGHPDYPGPSTLDFHFVTTHTGIGYEWSTDFVPLSEIHKVLVNEKFFGRCFTRDPVNIYLKVLARLPVETNSTETIYMSSYLLNQESATPMDIAGFDPTTMTQEELEDVRLPEIDPKGYVYPTDPTKVCNSPEYVALVNQRGRFFVDRGEQDQPEDGTILKSVYPMPFNEALTVEFDGPLEGAVRIRLIDVTGKLVYDENVNLDGAALHTINGFGDLSNGMYVLSLDNDVLHETRRVVKH